MIAVLAAVWLGNVVAWELTILYSPADMIRFGRGHERIGGPFPDLESCERVRSATIPRAAARLRCDPVTDFRVR